jgi:Arc/MetJ family transcription regulator
MGKTTVVIDEKLLEDAVRAAGVKTKREAIEAGLQELISKAGREMLRKELGTFDLDLTLKKLQRLRHAR